MDNTDCYRTPKKQDIIMDCNKLMNAPIKNQDNNVFKNNDRKNYNKIVLELDKILDNINEIQEKKNIK
jgi:hypothetical protein